MLSAGNESPLLSPALKVTRRPRSYPLVRESFREVFVKFLAFSDVFELARTCSDAFGPVRMRSDAIGCILSAFGRVGTLPEIFGFFRTFWVIFDVFLTLGAYYYCRFTCTGLTIIGANYWEEALALATVAGP